MSFASSSSRPAAQSQPQPQSQSLSSRRAKPSTLIQNSDMSSSVASTSKQALPVRTRSISSPNRPVESLIVPSNSIKRKPVPTASTSRLQTPPDSNPPSRTLNAPSSGSSSRLSASRPSKSATSPPPMNSPASPELSIKISNATRSMSLPSPSSPPPLRTSDTFLISVPSMIHRSPTTPNHHPTTRPSHSPSRAHSATHRRPSAGTTGTGFHSGSASDRDPGSPWDRERERNGFSSGGERGGNTSDSASITLSHAFDMKRLLSKPAPPSGASASESEGGRGGVRAQLSRPREKERREVKDDAVEHPPKSRLDQVQTPGGSTSIAAKEPKEKRQRNVLRRRPSNRSTTLPAGADSVSPAPTSTVPTQPTRSSTSPFPKLRARMSTPVTSTVAAAPINMTMTAPKSTLPPTQVASPHFSLTPPPFSHLRRPTTAPDAPSASWTNHSPSVSVSPSPALSFSPSPSVSFNSSTASPNTSLLQLSANTHLRPPGLSGPSSLSSGSTPSSRRASASPNRSSRSALSVSASANASTGSLSVNAGGSGSRSRGSSTSREKRTDVDTDLERERERMLTPAGAVAEAYKRQEARRGELSSSGSGSTLNFAGSSSKSGVAGAGLDLDSALRNVRERERMWRSQQLSLYREAPSESSSSLGLAMELERKLVDEEGGRARGGFEVIERVIGELGADDVDAEISIRVPAHISGHAPKSARSRERHVAHSSEPPPPPPSPRAPYPHEELPSSLPYRSQEDDAAGGPYYTVFGSSAGRVVAVGGPEDYSWEAYGGLADVGADGRETREVKTKRSGEGLGKTLTRKVSGRWKREREREEGEGHVRGRQSLQEVRRRGNDAGEERWGSSTVGRGSGRGGEGETGERKSLRLSIDKFADGDDSLDFYTSPTPRQRTHKGPSTEVPIVKMEVPAERGGGKLLKSPLSLAKKGDSLLGGAGDGGKKIWKLMKKISTGGLRDKFHDHAPASPPPLPPVPALPKDYQGRVTTDSLSPHQQDGKGKGKQTSTPSTPLTPTGGVLSRFMPSRSSLSSPGTPATSPISSRRPSFGALKGSALSPPAHPSSAPPPPAPPPISTPASSSSAPATAALNISGSRHPPLPPLASTPPTPSNRSVHGTPPVARQSTTTRSSSPVSSSDVASSRFFHRAQSQSTRSSTSSFTNHNDSESAPPPPPPPVPQDMKHMIGRHIVPPSELYRVYSGDTSEQEHGREREREREKERERERGGVGEFGAMKLVLPKPVLGGSWPAPSRTSEDWMIVRSPSVELPSLPLPPPRREADRASRIISGGGSGGVHGEEGRDGVRPRATSPAIPVFSTASVINSFRRTKSSSDGKASWLGPEQQQRGDHSTSPPLVTEPTERDRDQRRTSRLKGLGIITPGMSSLTSLPPPPRPSRSAQRPNVNPESSSSSGASSRVTSPSRRAYASPVSVLVSSGCAVTVEEEGPKRDRDRDRESSGTHSTASNGTARPRRRSSSFITPGAAASAMTFRELGSAQGEKHTLTEQEKAEKWDDLLERSARAGGTLHLGGGAHELQSDLLRFSSFSEVSEVSSP